MATVLLATTVEIVALRTQLAASALKPRASRAHVTSNKAGALTAESSTGPFIGMT